MSDKYIDSFYIKDKDGNQTYAKIQIPLENVDGATALKNTAETVESKLNVLKEQTDFHEQIFLQSNIISSFDVISPDYYTSRETAGGASVMDNSLARIKKIEGNSRVVNKDANGLNGRIEHALFSGIKSMGRNLIPSLYGLVSDNKYTYGGLTYTINKDGTIIIDGTATANSVLSITTLLKNNNMEVRLPQAGNYTLVSGISGGSASTYYFSCQLLRTGVGDSNDYIAGTNATNELASFEILESQLKATKIVNFYFWAAKGQTFNNVIFTPMLYYGEEVIPYTEYKETTNFTFPETELPLGSVIDFEDKKIYDYGVTIELTGNETHWNIGGYRQGDKYYTALRSDDVLPSTDFVRKGIVTDGQISAAYDDGVWWIGAGSGNRVLYVLGAERYFNLMTFADPYNPTEAEQNALKEIWRSYLRERYNSGNPITIRYISSTLQNEKSFNDIISNSYQVQSNGMEVFIDKNNMQSSIGLKSTINYINPLEA